MAGIETTGSFPKLLWPGINKIAQTAYEEYANGAEWKQIFDIETSKKNYEEDVGFVTFGRAVRKPEGSPIQYDARKQGFVPRYVHVPYGLGVIITHEEIADCLYDVVSRKRTQQLVFAFHQAKEIDGADILNFAFDPGTIMTGGDGTSLINDSHPTDGGSFSNTLDVAADLSEASIEQLLIKIEDFRDNRNNKIKVIGNKLIVPKELRFEAERILKGTERYDTANRDINAMYKMGMLPQGIVSNHYLVQKKAWFIRTNCPDGLKHFARESFSLAQDNAFETMDLKFRGYERWSFGWTDPRGVAGSPGA